MVAMIGLSLLACHSSHLSQIQRTIESNNIDLNRRRVLLLLPVFIAARMVRVTEQIK